MSSQPTQTAQQLSEQESSKLFHADEFGELFDADKNRLYSYIYAYVLDPVAADDIFQETCLTLWKEFEKFEAGSSFSKWANGIAFNRIRVFRRNQGKYELGLTDDFLKEFSNNIAIIESNALAHEQKWRHLEHCYTLLSSPMKKIYQSFYTNNLMAQEIAENTGRSIYAIRKAVHKLRNKLFDCIEKNSEDTK
ncbi:MAG: sigma-70 family RNA polymerase sigma factor [Thalassotalea sp.]